MAFDLASSFSCSSSFTSCRQCCRRRNRRCQTSLLSNLSSHFSYQITAKFNGANLPLWLQQVEPVFPAHQLHCFSVSPQVPSCYLTVGDQIVDKENPAFVDRELHDKLLAWLQSSLVPSVLPKVIGCRYTWQLWEKVDHHSQIS